MRSIPNSVRLAIVWLVVMALVVACGSGEGSTFGPAGDGDDGGGSSGSSGGFVPGAAEGGVATDPNCKPLTCADQKIECGPAGDGCGGIIAECGKCGAGLRCGGPGALSKCVSPSIGTGCTPQTCAQLNIGCGLAGDGCGGPLTCPTCAPGQQCGITGTPSQCVTAVPTGPDGGACVLKTCADYLLENKNCGPQSNGCGGMVDCGACTGASEFCGGGGPSKCAVSGGGACTPKTCVDFPGKCGAQSDNCGGVTFDCGGCTLPAICGGGGTPSVCGGGILPGPGGGACVPRTACGALECGKVADGCGGILDCLATNCTGTTICGGAGVANQCGAPNCVKLAACPAGKNCGSVADGCGGTVVCGGGVACTLPAICGGGGTANVCGGGTITGPGGGACVPLAVCPAGSCGPIADGCGGSIACGGCVSPAVCGGGGTPSVCGGGNQCTPQSKVLACGAMNCGYAADGCGGSHVCGPDADPACPTGQSCGLYAPNQCGSLQGPCITTGAATKCASNSDCCSGFCGATGTCSAAACKNIPVACATNNECCSGKCTAGLCAATNGGTCKASGSTCGGDAECCSQGCISGICSVVTSFCRQNGDACTASTQCCGGTCTGATPTQAGYCSTVDAPGGGTGCTIAGTVIACDSSTTYTCNAACCSGSCGPNDSGGGKQICQQTASCKVKGELCTKDVDCCGNGVTGSLLCSKPAGAGVNDYGRCNRDNSCQKPGQVCKTAADSCSFSNNCCEPADIAPGINCSNTPSACCRHDNNGVPRCTQFAVCRTLNQTCESPADCCPVGGATPPCAPDAGGVFRCAAACLVDNAVCTIDRDCCGGNCFKQTAGATTGLCKIPTCTKLTCAAYPNKCGALSDGCGGIALAADGITPSCGGCTLPQTCGGAGVPNECGGTLCTANTCAGLNAECGTVPDGCGVLLTCPPCATGTCGGGGVANKCGSPTCTGQTCTGLMIDCGQTGDGCGNVLTCMTCPPNTTCGGGGLPNKCGAPACTPITTCPAGKNCGDHPNGCGGSINCGMCPAGETCGGGGAANVCGKAICATKTCLQQGAQCGTISDQCGGVVTCPPCAANQFCNGQNLCVGLACTAKTCIELGVQCGPTADGCGALVDCGGCPVGSGCGAGGVPGKCGTQACAPKTCAELGAVCGQVANGCGALTPSCGTCAGSLSCKNGACVNACTPRTCASIGAKCGPIADGCGSTVDCGMCINGETCGYNNIANQCGKDQPK